MNTGTRRDSGSGSRPRGGAWRGVSIFAALTLAALCQGTAATQWGPAVDRVSSVSVGLALNDAAITPGETLTVGAVVNNTGSAGLADFVFAVLLPDGSTIVSAGPGIGASFGRFSDLRTLVPVARNISLASPFQYQNGSFFSHRFTGTEPNGQYRVYLASLRAGALNDGVVGGGELLALETRQFVVSPALTTVIDPTRRATASIPPSGGSVATTAANGTGYQLTFPSGALASEKPITITPIVSASHLPNNGTFALGLRAEPSGLTFPVPATLTATLPAGAAVSPRGYSAILSSADGRSVQTVPALLEGRTITVTVPHFSDVVVVDSVFGVCAEPASAEMGDACRVLQAAFTEFGGFNAPGFKAVAEDVLGEWFSKGLRPRVDATQEAPPPADVDEVLDTLYDETLAWLAIYEAAFGEVEVGNRSRPLPDELDFLFAGLSLATSFAQDRANARCLADRANAADYIQRVFTLTALWTIAFDRPPLFEKPFCVDLSIDAAPSPALTPGSPSPLPLAILAKFSDGVEMPGRQALLTITATEAMVAPAGGSVTLPFFGPVILTPQSTTTTVTITGQFTEPAFALLPVRTRTFVGGTPAGLQVTAAALQARSHASLPGDGAPFLPEVKDATSTFAPRQSVSAPLDVSHQAGGWSYRAIANSEAARSVSVTADEATVVGSGKKSADLTATGGTGFIPAVFARAAAAPADTICFRLPRRYTATYNLTSNGPRRRNSTSSGDLVSLNFGAETSVGAPGPGTTSGTVILEAGDRCMTLEVDLWQCSITNGVTVGCDLPRSLEWSYTVALRPAP